MSGQDNHYLGMAFTFYLYVWKQGYSQWMLLTVLNTGFSSLDLKAQVSKSDRLSPVCLSVRPSLNFSHVRLLFQDHGANFNQTWQKAFIGEGDSRLLNEGQHPFLRGDNYEIAKLHWQNLKVCFFWTAVLILTNFCTNLSWLIGIQPFSKGR